ncbi:hypothetical protein JKP88DRAFT_170553, partial [Tribonema minus]
MRVRTGPALGNADACWSANLAALKDAIATTPEGEEGDAALVDLLSNGANQDLFEDQPNLTEWIPVLDRIDAALESSLRLDPALVLIKEAAPAAAAGAPAGGEGVVVAGPDRAPLVLACLRFTAVLLQNSTNKAIYSSTEHLLALLAARDDGAVELALRCLAAMEMPAALHRQSRGDMMPPQQFSSLDAKGAAKKLTILSQGWGGRGQGLGLLSCVT